MALSAQTPFVSVQVAPVDPEAANRTQWTLNENFAGCFQAGSDGGADESAGIAGFQSNQFANIPTLIDLKGPVDFVRFGTSGRVEHGTTAALQSNPSSELCGLTVQLRHETLSNRIYGEGIKVEDPADAKPIEALPRAILMWREEQGNWETVLPAREPHDICVHPYPLEPNKSYKIKTDDPWPADQGFIVLWDFNGVTENHVNGPAVRITWGEKWSLVFRGKGPKIRPSIERREKNKQWNCVKVLGDCAPLDDQFWTASHTVSVQLIGARLCVAVDGIEYGIVETVTDSKGPHPRAASWPRAPLRISLIGVDTLLRVHRLTGTTEPDKDGKTHPITVSFERKVPAPGLPPFEQGRLDFQLIGHASYFKSIPIPGPDPSALRGSLTVKAQMLGTNLDNVGIAGSWEGTIAHYAVLLVSTPTTPPLLSSMVAQFKPLPSLALPEPVEIRPAVSSLSVDSGDPESLPDSEAQFSLSQPLLEQLVPGWKTAILPYRPVLIRAKYDEHDEWTTLFRGYLTPDSITRDSWNDKQLPLVARGPLVRLSQPAALIDERFGPLDLELSNGKAKLWGCEAARELLGIELGPSWTENFNGNGDPFRYLPEGHPALLDPQNGGLFDALRAPLSGNWRFPPPFGSDIKSWVNTLAKYDCAVWFYDAASDAFYYGRLLEMMIERGHTLWSVPETAPPPSVSTTRDWPLLSRLEKSGLLEQAFNDVRVWGAAPKGSEGFSPSFIMGRAGDADPNSLDPISVVQSWRRTRLEKPEFAKEGVIDSEGANGIAFYIWQQFKGRPPVQMEAEFESGFLGPRWGEILHLPTGFDGPNDQGHAENWRILRVKHAFDFTGSQNRFSTTITTRTLSAQGQ